MCTDDTDSPSFLDGYFQSSLYYEPNGPHTLTWPTHSHMSHIYSLVTGSDDRQKAYWTFFCLSVFSMHSLAYQRTHYVYDKPPRMLCVMCRRPHSSGLIIHHTSGLHTLGLSVISVCVCVCLQCMRIFQH
jgi:hypothetical protein